MLGAGGSRTICFGFASSFGAVPTTERAMMWIGGSGSSFVGARGDTPLALTNSPLGRNLAPGDVCTVRLGRQEGSPDIDIARFYVNGQKVYETLNIPTEDCYAGIGVYTDISKRKYNLPVRVSKGVKLQSGKIVIRYVMPKDDGGRELARTEFLVS